MEASTSNEIKNEVGAEISQTSAEFSSLYQSEEMHGNEQSPTFSVETIDDQMTDKKRGKRRGV